MTQPTTFAERDAFWRVQRAEAVRRGDEPEVIAEIDKILADVLRYRADEEGFDTIEQSADSIHVRRRAT